MVQEIKRFTPFYYIEALYYIVSYADITHLFPPLHSGRCLASHISEDYSVQFPAGLRPALSLSRMRQSSQRIDLSDIQWTELCGSICHLPFMELSDEIRGCCSTVRNEVQIHFQSIFSFCIWSKIQFHLIHLTPPHFTHWAGPFGGNDMLN